MKRTLILSVICLLLSPAPLSLAQNRQRTTPRRGAPKSRPSETQNTANARTEGATHVADQIKNLTRFLYLLGGISKGIEAADAAARRGEATQQQVEQIEKNKMAVKESLRNVREGLDQLEIDFRTRPELLRYYTTLAGVAAGAANAEDQAAAGQFEQAGRSLLAVVNRLTDVLLEMR